MADGSITIDTKIEIDGLKNQVAQIVKQLNNVDKNTGNVFAKMRDYMQGPVAVLGQVKEAIVAIGNATIMQAAKIEDMEAAFTPLVGGADNARAMIAALNKEAATTPFELEGIGSVAKQLLPVLGNDVKAVTETFRMLGDTAGGNMQKLDSITRGYMKSLLKGKVDMESLNMIAEAGVPIYKELADSLGVTTAEMMDMSSKGKITAADLTKAFKDMTSEGGIFFDGMNVASQTLNGKLSTLSDNVKQAGAAIGKEMLPATKELVDATNKIIESFVDWSNKGDNLKKTINGIKTAIDIFFAVLNPTSAALKMIRGNSVLLESAIKKAGASIEYAFVIGFASAKAAALQFGITIIDKVLGAIQTLLKSLSGIPGVGKLFTDMSGNIDSVKRSLQESASAASSEANTAIAAAKNKRDFITAATNQELNAYKAKEAALQSQDETAKRSAEIAALYGGQQVETAGEMAKADNELAATRSANNNSTKKQFEDHEITLGKLNAAYKDFFTVIAEGAKSSLDEMKAFSEQVSSSIGGVSETIDLITFKGPIEDAKELYDRIIEISQGIEKIVADGPAIAEKMTDALMEAIDSIVDNLPGLVQAGVGIITKIIVSVIENLPEIITGLVKAAFLIGPALIEAVIKAIPEIIKAIFLLPYELAKALPDMVRDIGKSMYEIGKETANFIGIGLKAAIDFIKWIGDLLPKPSDFEPFNIADVGKFIVDQIKNGINLAGAIFDGTVAFFQAFFTALGNFFLGAFDLGGQIIQGIANGILNAPKLFDSVVQFFQDFIDGFKAFFLIGSPSKVFEGFGGNLIEGIVNGITGAGNIFDSVKGVFESLLSSIGDLFSSGFDIGGDLVSSIADGVKGIVHGAGKAAGKVKDWLGFASGGYTGNGPADEVAGVVHKGEYVLNRDQTQALMSGRGLQSVVEGIRGGVSIPSPSTSQPINITLHNMMNGSIQVSGREIARIVMENIDSSVWALYGNQS